VKEEENPMISFLRRPLLAALFVAAVTSVTVIALEPLYAQYGQVAQAGKAKAKQKQDPSTTARREVGTPINDALKLVEAKKWDEALAKVQQADNVKDKTPYEEFMVAKYIAYIAVNREPQDIPAATAAVNRQIASNGAPDEEKANMHSMGMLLNYAAMDYAKVVQSAEQLKALNQPFNEQQNLVLVQAYYSTMDYANAAKVAKEASDQQPSADLLGLLLNSQAKMKDDAGYRVTLDKLATVSAQPEVWGQVMDFALDAVSKGPMDGQEHRLLNLFRLASLVGTMKAPQDHSAMASIGLQIGLPNEAKQVLAKGNITTGELVTQANTLAANDQASLATLAAEVSKLPDGEGQVKLGESYMTYDRHEEAVNAIRAGIQKGGIKDMADAQTTLGIALYRAGKKEEALAEFRKAEMASTPSGTVAHVWALFLQRPAA
jgi:tetratricopeptide (TPR) repeat protein